MKQGELSSGVILVADDDADDRMLIRRALQKSNLHNPIVMVRDGEELMDYLCRRGAFADSQTAPRPALILLDLNMPRKSGREALQEIKTHPELRRIPIIVLTTSGIPEDVYESYELGANAYVSKPVSFRELARTVSGMREFWLRIAKLPHY